MTADSLEQYLVGRWEQRSVANWDASMAGTTVVTKVDSLALHLAGQTVQYWVGRLVAMKAVRWALHSVVWTVQHWDVRLVAMTAVRWGLHSAERTVQNWVECLVAMTAEHSVRYLAGRREQYLVVS